MTAVEIRKSKGPIHFRHGRTDWDVCGQWREMWEQAQQSRHYN